MQARASLNQTEVNLGHTIITAPIDGVVISRNVDVGQTVAASMQAPTLFVIAQDLTAMQVNASVAESDIGRIAAGQPVTFRVDAYPGTDLHRHGLAGASRAGRGAERRQLRHDHRRAEPGSEAQARHDGERDHRDRAGVTTCFACRMRRCACVRPPRCWSPSARRRRTSRRRTGAPTAAGDARHSGDRADATARCGSLRDGLLTPVPVVIGTTDASHTAVVAGDLDEGVEVVTGITTPAAAPSTAAPTRSPLLPAPRRPGGAGTAPRAR